MNAQDNVTIEIDYDRPFFTFPELSSPEGNPMHYWGKAISTIERNGFKNEGQYIRKYHSKTLGGITIPSIPYEEQFDFLNRFLDFQNKEEILKEDEEFVYLKVRKESTAKTHNGTRQPLLFSIKDIDTLKDLIENDEDLSLQNCYGRNMLYYVEEPVVLQFLLTENKKHKWFDLFSLDFFNASVLHGHNNLTTFPILLKAMYDEDPILSNRFFLASSSFHINASGMYLTLLDSLFCRAEQAEINMDDWKKFAESLSIIKLVNIEMFNDIVRTINDIPLIKTHPDSKLYMYMLLNNSLPEKNDSLDKTPHKSKI